MNPRVDKLSRIAVGFGMGMVAAIFVIISMRWRLGHDTSLYHYMGYLIAERDFFPYTDLFEISMPGTFLFHAGVGSAFGFSDFGFRVADLFYMTGLMVGTWYVMRHLCATVAIFAILAFMLLYLGGGPSLSLQRDCVGLLLVVWAIAAALRTELGIYTRVVLVGLLFGLAATLKPHAAIGAPVVIAWLALPPAGQPFNLRGWIRGTVIYGAISAAVFVCAVAIPFLWVVANGALDEFRDIFSNYLPLYLQLNGAHEILGDDASRVYTIKSYLKGVVSWIPLTAAGLFVALRYGNLNSEQQRLVVLLGVLAFVYSLYVAVAGQFWRYHWFPFRYFAILCGALLFLPLPGIPRVVRALLPLLFLGLAFGINPPRAEVLKQLAGAEPNLPADGRSDRVAEFILEAELADDEVVQPLDWVGGSLYGLLIAEARLATSFIYDFQFYHHVSDPYIQTIRQRFLRELEEAGPRFIVRIPGRSLPRGPDTTREFADLEEFVAANYLPVYEEGGVIILERR